MTKPKETSLLRASKLSCKVGRCCSACACLPRIDSAQLGAPQRCAPLQRCSAALSWESTKLAPVFSGRWSRADASSLWPKKPANQTTYSNIFNMISVIHPAANHFPPMGSMPMLTAGTSGHPVMGPYPAFKADQISSDVLYRRRGSGYTHLSNSWSNPNASQTSMKNNAVSNVTSRSLSNYAPRSSSQSGVVQPIPQVNRATSVASASRIEQVKKSSSTTSSRGLIRPPAGKDFSKPLFVDCSIEYELPNAPKIPKNSLPILMIHPGYKQKMSMIQKKEVAAQQAQCSTPNCQCKLRKVQPQHQPLQPQVKKDIKAGMKRSYNTMTNSTVAPSTDFYMKHLQPQNHPGEYFTYTVVVKS